MPWSMGWTMPRRGLWEGSPSQHASISCQHSSSNTGRRSGRAPRERSMEISPELVRGRPIQQTGLLSSQADDPVGAQGAQECNKLWLQLHIPSLEPNSNSDGKLEHTGMASWRVGNFKEKPFWDSSITCCLMGGPAAVPGLSLLLTGEFGQSRACGSYLSAHCSRDGLCWHTSQMPQGAWQSLSRYTRTECQKRRHPRNYHTSLQQEGVTRSEPGRDINTIATNLHLQRSLHTFI